MFISHSDMVLYSNTGEPETQHVSKGGKMEN